MLNVVKATRRFSSTTTPGALLRRCGARPMAPFVFRNAVLNDFSLTMCRGDEGVAERLAASTSRATTGKPGPQLVRDIDVCVHYYSVLSMVLDR